MATHPAPFSPRPLPAGEHSLFRIAALALSGFAVLVFGAFSLAMAFDPLAFPITTHLHAFVMLGWLGLFSVQAMLATGGDIALHRRLGWLGAGLAAGVVVLGSVASASAVAEERLPPIFAPGYFLVLTHCGLAVFAALVGGAIAQRRRSDWHKRLMLGSLLVIYEPVFGRLALLVAVPALGGPDSAIPAIMAHREAFELARALAHIALAVGVVALDWRVSGRLHPAWGIALGGIALVYLAANTLGFAAPVATLAQGLGAGGPLAH